MEELIKEVESLSEEISTHCGLMDIFSDDKGKQALAQLKSKLRKVLFKLKATQVKQVSYSDDKPYKPNRGNSHLVRVRPVGEEYKEKTFIGFYIGDIALSTGLSIEDDSIFAFPAMHNPAIYVPELKKVIFGAESWWGEIKSEQQLNDITDGDIDNVWYVKMWKELHHKKQDKFDDLCKKYIELSIREAQEANENKLSDEQVRSIQEHQMQSLDKSVQDNGMDFVIGFLEERLAL